MLIEKYHDHLDAAWSTFHSVSDSEKDIVLVTNMMKVLLHCNHYHDALSLYHEYAALNDDVSRMLALRALIQIGRSHDALELYRKDGGSPVLALSALSNTKDTALYHKMKGDILNAMNLENEQHVLALIECAGCFDDIDFAQNTIDSLPQHQMTNSIVYGMMRMLIDSESPHSANDALDLYQRHCDGGGIVTDRRIHSLALKCCGTIKCHEFGEEVVSEHFQNDLDVVDSMALIAFYGSFDIDAAQRIFDDIDSDHQTVESVSCWMTALIENDRGRDALTVYDKWSALRDDVTNLLAVKAAINCGDFERGKAIESRVYADGAVPISFENVLISFYGEFEDIAAAERVFASIPNEDKTIVTVGSMLSAYSRCKMYNECWHLFETMDRLNDSLKPNVICYRIMLSACSEGDLFQFGQDLHYKLRENKNRRILTDRSVQIHLIKMYGKMGMLTECNSMFGDIRKYQEEEWRNEIAIWNVMVSVYGLNGDLDGAQRIYRQMIDETNMMPDDKTYIHLLTACAHCNELERAKVIWSGIVDPDIKEDSFVVTAFVDCLARNGALDEGYVALMEYEKERKEHHPNDKAIWIALLSGCRKYENRNLGNKLFEAFCERQFGAEAMSEATVLMNPIFVL